ncbi:MAG: MlaA family lipoprotein [Paracoccaceae bacterium]
MALTRYTTFCAAVVVLLVAGCSTPPDGADPAIPHDPYEVVNRKTHAFNKSLDTVALRPAAAVFDAVVPDPVEPLVRNAADNLGTPSHAVNHLLQGEFWRATKSTMRFAFNTTIGLGGLFDPASELGLVEDKTDFGETLYKAGITEGAYVEMPVLGPSTERDAFGTIVDFALDPIGQLTGAERKAASNLQVAGIVATRSQFGDTIDGVLYDSIDSYTQSQLFYLQRRRFTLGDTRDAASDDPFALDTEGF